MNIKTKITTAAALGSLAASILMPSTAFAAVKIKGNGAKSKNAVVSVNYSKKFVGQSNLTGASTGVASTSNTGDNAAKNNTGGSGDDVSVKTGNVTTTTTVSVNGGGNTNSGGQGCCCGEENTNQDVTISGNGARSWNGVLLVDICKNIVVQQNETLAETSVVTVSNTGGNAANGNTGGDVSIDTGNTTTTTTVTVTGGSNTNN